MEKRFRIKKEGTFNYVFKKGTRYSTDNLVLIAAPSKEGLKFGLSVSKKCGKAVIRNKIKRRLRMIITEIIPTLGNSTLYVILAKPTIAEVSYQDLEKEVKTVFENEAKENKV